MDMKIKIFKTIVCVLLFSWWPGTAQDMEVPIDVQCSIFCKILEFDHNIDQRLNNEIIIGVLYQRKFSRSNNINNELIRVMKQSPVKKIKDVAIRIVALEITDHTDLTKMLAKNKIDILYVTPLRAISLRSITKASRAAQILTFTGIPKYVESGIAVSVELKGGKPHIIINLTSSRAEGAEFNSQLLNLAKVIN